MLVVGVSVLVAGVGLSGSAGSAQPSERPARTLVVADKDLTHGQTTTVSGSGLGRYPNLTQCVVPKGGPTKIDLNRDCDWSSEVDVDPVRGAFSVDFVVRGAFTADDHEVVCPRERCVVAAYDGTQQRVLKTVPLRWADKPRLPKRPTLVISDTRLGKNVGTAKVRGSGFEPGVRLNLAQCRRPVGMPHPDVDTGLCIDKSSMRPTPDAQGRFVATFRIVRDLTPPTGPARLGRDDCKVRPTHCSIANPYGSLDNRMTRVLFSQAR